LAATVLIALMLLQPTEAAPAPAPVVAPGYRVGPGPEAPDGTAPAGYRLLPEAPIPTPRLEHTGVTIDAYDARAVEGPRAADDQAYAATVLGGAAIAQQRQGPLDGAWRLADAAGRPLYDVQLADTGESLAAEGAWRAIGGGRRSGFMLVGREAGRTTLRFFEPGGSSPILIELEPLSDGSWRGRLVRDGTSAPVTLRRR
jgi:hypothetical protein